MDELRVLPILRSITETEFPNELAAFDFEAERRFREILNEGSMIASTKSDGLHTDHFALEAMSVIEALAAVIGTAHTILELKYSARISTMHGAALEALIQKHLHASGVKASRIERISARIAGALTEVMKS